jgi:hypothetical protein
MIRSTTATAVLIAVMIAAALSLMVSGGTNGPHAVVGSATVAERALDGSADAAGQMSAAPDKGPVTCCDI